ncbi:hypothetical protein J1614_001936 [Plenodomus biglobosus]|nr:hypothetical protein J1614_001936 [Plenodomus biglobosus]
MGNDWMISDRTGDDAGNDFMTQQFLKNHSAQVPHLPLLEEMAQYKDKDGKHSLTVMSRARAVTLESVWRKITRQERRVYAQQLVAALRELRQFTAEYPQRVDGGPLWDNIVGTCNSRKDCIKFGKTKEEWLDSMDAELREGLSWVLRTKNASVIDARLQEIKQNLPDGAPYVLTHADLNLGNILVHDGKIVAIIDWELAGYQPWWVEVITSYHRSLSHAGKELFDYVWKKLNIDVAEVFKVVQPVIDATEKCDIGHTGRTPKWHRPAFCECKPFGGEVWSGDVDSEDKHFIDHSKHPIDDRTD